jgi:hypothetical protein
MELLLRNKDILCSIMEYIGSIKFCIFTFSLLFKELDGRYGYVGIADQIKDIFIHHIYKNLYIEFFKPISQNQNNIDKLHQIICSTKRANAVNAANAANAVNCEELSLIYAERTVLCITTPHSDNTWFIKTLEEYYYIGGIQIDECQFYNIDRTTNFYKKNIHFYPMCNIILSNLDKQYYRFHLDGISKYITDYDNYNYKLNLINADDLTYNDTYECYHKFIFWILLTLLFHVNKNEELISIKKQCIIELYKNYYNNSFLSTYTIDVFHIYTCYNAIYIQSGGIHLFLQDFNEKYPNNTINIQLLESQLHIFIRASTSFYTSC